MFRVLKPLAISFSEYYFYLIGFIDNLDDIDKKLDYSSVSPTIYRVDRIQKYNVLEDHFVQPYSERFEEGEFRKRITFMFGGKLHKIKFKYAGKSIEAIIDKLPTAKILSVDNGIYSIVAESYGDGIDMWFRSQGDSVYDIEEC